MCTIFLLRTPTTGKPALTEALNTIKDETKQHKIQN